MPAGKGAVSDDGTGRSRRFGWGAGRVRRARQSRTETAPDGAARRTKNSLRARPRDADRPCGLSEHLALLRAVGLVCAQKRGRERVYHLDPRPLTEVGAWLNVMLAFWTHRLN